MDEPSRIHTSWRLEIRSPHARALERSLGPESEGYHELDADAQVLVATGQGTLGESLHTLDDVLACLSAAMDTLEDLEA